MSINWEGGKLRTQMKVKITYQTDNELDKILEVIRSVYPRFKVRKSNKHPPFLHAYITVENAKKD